MLSFLLLNAVAALGAFGAARAAGATASTERGLLFTACGYLVAIHSAVLAAGLSAQLLSYRMALLVAAGAAVTWAIDRRRRGAGDLEPGTAGARFTAPALVAPVAAAAAVVWAWPHLAHATRLWIWDDYIYHMVYPALWLRDHAIAAAAPAQAFTMQAWYPLSASVVAAWFMAPFDGARGDALAWVSLTGVLYALIVAAGAAELLARLGCRRGAWAVPVVLLVTSRRVDVMASSFSDADLAQAATLFAAFVLAVPRGETEGRRDVMVDAAYAALLSGLAIGVKVSAAPYAVIVLVMMALRAVAVGPRGGAIARTVLTFAAGWTVTGAYWYARNVVHAGNPVYPAKFLVWPGATFPHTTLREYAAQYGVTRAVRDALAVYLDWPPPHAALAIVGLLGLAVWLAVRWRERSRARAWFAWGALAITVVMLVLLPSTPYSAGNGMTFAAGFIHWDSMRYVALLPILGWTALGFLLDAGAGAPRWRTGAALVVVAAALLVSPLDVLSWVVVFLVLATGAIVTSRMPPLPIRATWAGAALLGVVLASVLAWSHQAKAAATAASFHREPLFGPALQVLDRQPPGTKVAIFGDQWTYPAFGSRGHLAPVRLDGDGRIATAPIGDAMTPGPLTVDAYTFRANLRTSGVGLVAVVHLPHPGRSVAWPPQAAALDAAGGVRLLYRDGAVGLWKVEVP